VYGIATSGYGLAGWRWCLSFRALRYSWRRRGRDRSMAQLW